ncbi:MAG: HAD-IA family hydrolase [Burkholderiales bacterium]
MKRYSLVIFDWDGTLLDSTSHIAASIQAASRDMGLEEPSDDDARHIIGLGLADAMAYLFPTLAVTQHGRLAERYRHHYLAGETRISLFEGVEDGLKRLHDRGHLLAVATGKSRRGLDRAFDTTGLRPWFHGSRCADEGFAKPHPDMLEHLLDVLGVERQAALMVGDTTHDIEMAHGARMDSMAVTYGAHATAKLTAARPTHQVDSPSALWTWLDENA